MPASPTLDNEVSFISGVAPDGTLQLNSFASWNPGTINPATYTGGFTNAYKWGADTAGTPGGTVDYYFDPASNWTPTEQQAFIAGLALWSDIANITFVQTTNPALAQVTFTRGATNTGAFTDPQLTGPSGAGVTGGTTLLTPSSAKVSIDTTEPGFGPITGNFDSFGGYVYSTIVHEEGHVMGLGHAGPYNGNVTPSTQQFSAYDSQLYSIMSYISPSASTNGPAASSAKYYSQYPVTGTDWGRNAQGYSYVPTTWMQADILAVQRLYGLPTSTPLSGGQTFGFNSNVSGPSGIFFDFTKNTSPVVTLWDEGTGNTLNLSGFSTASNINLNAGTFSSCDAMTNNICIAQGTAIDDLVEGNGANTILGNNDGDIIVGGTGNDTITGGTGNDTITGGLGNNTINGGLGTNTLVVLGNSASYTITHNLNGTVTVQGAGETDTLTNIQYAAFTDKTVNLANTVIDYPNGSNNASGIVLTDNSVQLQVATGSATQSGVISESGGSFSFAKIGAATLILTANETNTGGTTITAGTLQVGTGGTTGALGSGAVVNNGILEFDHSSNDALNGLSGSGSMAQIGGGTLTLTGGASSGGLTISSSAVVLGDVNTGNALTGNIIDNGAVQYNFPTGTVTYGGSISGSGTLQLAGGGGLLVLTGNNTFTGVTTISHGAIMIGGQTSAGGATGSLTGNVVDGDVTSNVTLAFNRSNSYAYGGNISGLGEVDDDGPGVLTLTGNNTYSGVTFILQGTLAVNGDANLGTGAIEIGSGRLQFLSSTTSARNYQLSNGFAGATVSGAFDTNGFNDTFTGTVSSASGSNGGLVKIGTGILTLAGTNTYRGTTYIVGGTLALSGSANVATSTAVVNMATFDISQTAGTTIQSLGGLEGLVAGNTVALGSQILTISAAGGTTTDTTAHYYGLYNGVIQDGGIAGGAGGGLHLDAGTEYLTGANTYTGLTTIDLGATLTIGDNTATGSLGSGSVNDSGTLEYFLTSTATVANLISGSGGLLQMGTGNTILTAADTYNGATSVNAGTLTVNGSIISSAATVASGGTLSGTGTVGTTNVQSGGTLAPGVGIGTLHVNGNLTLASGSTYADDLSSSATDTTIVSGAASISGNLVENFSGGGYTVGKTYKILSATGGVSGAFANVSTAGLPVGLQGVVTYDADDVYVTIQGAVPDDFNGDSKSDILLQSDTGQPEIWFMNGAAVTSAALIGSNPGPTWHVMGAGDFGGNGQNDILWQSDTGQAAIWFMNGATDLGGPLIGSNPGPTWHIKGTGDFNGDGDSDILWQSDTGQAAIWFMNGATDLGGPLIGANPGPSWHIVGSGDFNGDGKSDILWQNDSGQAAIWFMNGSTVTSGPLIGNNPGPSWHIVGTGDFNGDGRSDILWQNANGQADIWFMNGATVTSTALIGSNPGPTWNIVGTADLNGDGDSDILWQSTHGQAAVWFMSGATDLGGPLLPSPGPAWQILNDGPVAPLTSRGGNFDGGRDGDILWQSDAGPAAIWFMSGATVTSGPLIGSNPGPTWHIKSAGDFNGDGQSDVVWQSDSGQAAIWFMNGATDLGGPLIGTNPGPTWHIMGTGDFNGDGDSDILWQSDSGQAAIWFMNGSTLTTGPLIGSNPGPDWQIKGVGDFNGDGDSDILWQAVSGPNAGQAAIWFMNGATDLGGPLIGSNPGPNWQIKGVGDFNGDGQSDVLWQAVSGPDAGEVVIWFMNGSTVTSGPVIGNNPGTSWNVVGTADLNGDGKSDILFQNTNGQAGAWLMSGATVLSAVSIGSNPGTSWHIINATG